MTARLLLFLTFLCGLDFGRSFYQAPFHRKLCVWNSICASPNTGSKENEGQLSSFLVDLNQPVLSAELSNSNLVKIVNLEATDQQCNQLCWKCLGYRFNPQTGTYDNSDVFPNWKARFPHPPDLIGVKRIYDPAVDKPVRDASVALMRSIHPDFKGGVRSLVSEGFRLYKISELTPNKTRRAQMVNWLLYYREQQPGK
eukprot:gene3881-4148_t